MKISKPYIWTVEEIQKMPEFGGNVGWFYGFVKYEGKLYFTEIFPGLGFANPVKEAMTWYSYWLTLRGRVCIYPWWHPKTLYWAIRDALIYRP